MTGYFGEPKNKISAVRDADFDTVRTVLRILRAWFWAMRCMRPRDL
jgi:hypothetical protein